MDVDSSMASSLEDDGDGNERESSEFQQTISPARHAPTYSAFNATKEDDPGPRYGHTLTPLAAVGQEGAPNYVGPRLILFGGVTPIDPNNPTLTSSGAARIRLCPTTYVHCYDVLTNKWSRITPAAKPPTPRVAHVATALRNSVIIQGGIGAGCLSDEFLHILNLAVQPPQWQRVEVQGSGPGPRYGHVMAALEQRYLVVIGGCNGKQPLADVWGLDTAVKPYNWEKLEPEGDGPPPCMFAAASARSDGLLLHCGGRDANSVALACAYGLAKHRDGSWEWAIAPGVSPSPRYQHTAVFVNGRLHVCGGAVEEDRMVEDSSSVAVFDTRARVWCDTKCVVTCPRTGRYSADAAGGDGAVELTRRFRHAAATIDNFIFIYGGQRGGVTLGDLVVAEEMGAGGMASAASHAIAAAVAASNAHVASSPPGWYGLADVLTRQPNREADDDGGALVLGDSDTFVDIVY